VLRTRAPVYSPCGFLPRLACVRHAASVRSEPGSNSPINLQLKRFWFGCSRNLAHPPLAKRTRGPLKVLAVPRNFFVVLLSSFQRPRTLAPASLRTSDRLYPSCSSLLARPAHDRLPSAPLEPPGAPHPSSRFRGRASYRACQLRVKLLVVRLSRRPVPRPRGLKPRLRGGGV
jgi:hypothetical protein